MFKKLIVTLLIFVMCVGIAIVAVISLPLPQLPETAKRGRFVLTDVAIVDVREGVLKQHQDVFLEGGRIAKIAPHKGVLAKQKRNFVTINSAGKFLIPGLWDMHSHSWKLSPELHHPLFIANGVTAVRDMSGCLDRNDSFSACPQDRRLWNKQIIDSQRVSPRYVQQSSYQTNGGNEVPSNFPEFFSVRNQADAKKLVLFYKQQGVVSIKPYTQLSKVQYKLLAREASQFGIRIAGHRPIAVSLEEAIEHAHASIEHARLFLFECKKGAKDFRDHLNPVDLFNADFMTDAINNRNHKKCDALMAAMANSDTWWTPTLTTLAMGAYSDDAQFLNDYRLEFIPWVVKKIMWEPDVERSERLAYDSNQDFAPLAFFKQAQVDVAKANDLGVKIMTGTDSTDTYVFSGSSMHDEMDMMSSAGMSAVDIIKSATLNPAIYSGLSKERGTVEKGMLADLVLLNKNPLSDIKNTRSIEAVFLNGDYYDRSAINEMRNYTVKMASNIRLNIILIWDMLSSPLWRVQLID